MCYKGKNEKESINIIFQESIKYALNVGEKKPEEMGYICRQLKKIFLIGVTNW